MRQSHEEELTPEQMQALATGQAKVVSIQEKRQQIQHDHDLRRQCVEYAIRSAAATPTIEAPGNVVEVAKAIYDFMTDWDIARFEDQK